ncbi:GNAT family N-acetyltransferase [Virgibacillus xinjiangensis]|uniref:GNAT family N-acetyltransferase n=1 Tax=Virgibacillus xinjiangensis TaxID=393090 RepID=A0ABV7CSK2_9BACI
MLKMRDLHEVPVLFELMSHPEVFPFVREKAHTMDECYFLTRKIIEAEANNEAISRTILDEQLHPIGTIGLYDMEENHGFLATWIGKPFFGKGFNQRAKTQFLDEVFCTKGMDGVFMKVRTSNTRSIKAVLKLPYATLANEWYPQVYRDINQSGSVYDLFVITKDHYLSYQQFSRPAETDEEEVS